MARIELPSGAWVDIREKLMASDKFAIQESISISMDGDANQHFTGGFINQMRNALLKEIITEWSFDGIPIPEKNPGGAQVLGTTLDLDDYNALSDAVEPLLLKVMNAPNRGASASS